MTEAGFFAQKRNSPTSLALVILLHAGVLGAVIMIKSPVFEQLVRPPTKVRLIEVDPDPPPVRPPRAEPERESHITQTRQIIQTERRDDTVIATWHPPQPPPFTGTVIAPPPPPPLPPPPVRRAAELDPRFAGELQPPYPAEEHRAQREGRVQVRVTIAASGRVSAIVRLMATSDAFWRVTERQALNHWRFRPATVDGRPVADSKVMSLTFRLVDQ
jgi:protein TonB